MSQLIVEMDMPKRCFDCPMHDWTYGLHETRQNVLVCNARHELTPILCQTIPNGDERPDWCPINGEISDIELMHLEEERAYQASVLMQEYFERYEPTYNSEDGSM